MLTKFGTYVGSVHAFDAAAFGLSASEAALMDPQARMLLEESTSAIVDSGRSITSLSGEFHSQLDVTEGHNPNEDITCSERTHPRYERP